MLVVEDEAILSLFVVRILRRLGAEVVATASSGEAAIPLLRSAKPDLALLDIRLSGALTGLDVARAALAQDSVFVALMSAYDFSQIPDLPTGSRVLGLLPKPLTERRLAELLDSSELRGTSL